MDKETEILKLNAKFSIPLQPDGVIFQNSMFLIPNISKFNVFNPKYVGSSDCKI